MCAAQSSDLYPIRCYSSSQVQDSVPTSPDQPQSRARRAVLQDTAPRLGGLGLGGGSSSLDALNAAPMASATDDTVLGQLEVRVKHVGKQLAQPCMLNGTSTVVAQARQFLPATRAVWMSDWVQSFPARCLRSS